MGVGVGGVLCGYKFCFDCNILDIGIVDCFMWSGFYSLEIFMFGCVILKL